MQDDRMVTVPFEYLLSTHVQMSASYDKLKELLGESVALALFAMAADAGLPAMLPSASSSVEELKEVLAETGYELSADEKDDTIEFRLKCPHADRIHPYLGENATFCPMSQMVLSTMRRKFGTSIVTDTSLVPDGSRFTIKVQK
jgi:hypothetical protein